MSSFLTLEDVNGAGLEYVNGYHEIDTGKIGTGEFSNVLYDFCIVSHSISGNNHTYTFQVRNSFWAGGYTILKSNGTCDLQANQATYDSSTKTITYVTDRSSIKLLLYLTSFSQYFQFGCFRYGFKDDAIIYIKKNQIGKYILRYVCDYAYNTDIRRIFEANLGVNIVNFGHDYPQTDSKAFYLCFLQKTTVEFNTTETLTVGKVNHTPLGVNSSYLPSGDLVDGAELDMTVEYNGETIPVIYDSTVGDYCFDLDLTDKTTDTDVKLKLNVYESEYVNNSTHEIILKAEYVNVNSFNALQTAISNGVEAVEVTEDITFTTDLEINHRLWIIGDNHNFNMNNHSIKCNDGVKFSNIVFMFGNPAIVQYESNIAIDGCSFHDCIINDKYKGSVLSGSGGATITNSNIVNCHHSIYYAGELTVDNCSALYNHLNDYTDTDYSEFLTIYDGSVEISNSIFDIDITDDNYCTNQINAKFIQSLFSLGEDTTFNSNNSRLLTVNDVLPFFESPYNNRAHLFIKYYYPQVSTCVVDSPVNGKEDKACCHNILGSDWIYKNNVKITRLDREDENTLRTINWSR